MGDDLPVIVCQAEGCVWAMEDFAEGSPILIPLMQAFVSHHFAEAHAAESLADKDFTAEELLAECRQIFEHYGIDPDDPYKELEPGSVDY